MRFLAVAAVLAAAYGLSGCGESTPADPYANMQMLDPQAAGGQQVDEDPVLEEERNFNARFVHKTKKGR